MDAAFGAGYTGYVVLGALGGAIARVPTHATAYPHRAALFSAEYMTDAAPGAKIAWCHQIRQTMRRWSSGGAYVNYLDPLLDNWRSAYYGQHYERLQQVKARYDPANLLRMAQGVSV